MQANISTLKLKQYSWKNEAFFSSLLSFSSPDLNSCEWSLTFSKTNSKIEILHSRRINAARRDEVLGKTTVDKQCQKFAIKKSVSVFVPQSRPPPPFRCSLNLQCAIYTHKSAYLRWWAPGTRALACGHSPWCMFCAMFSVQVMKERKDWGCSEGIRKPQKSKFLNYSHKLVLLNSPDVHGVKSIFLTKSEAVILPILNCGLQPLSAHITPKPLLTLWGKKKK